MPATTVTNVTPKGVIDFCRARGVSSDKLLSAAAIPPSLVNVPGCRLSADQAFALWGEARRATGDPLIAEHVAYMLPVGTYRIADYLLLTGTTPRDSLRKFIRNFPLVNGIFQLQLESAESGTYLELVSEYPPEETRFYVEFIFSMIFGRLRLAAGMDWHPKEVCFTHSSTPGVRDYHPTFFCRARFNESSNRMLFDKDFADIRLPNGDALLSEMLDHYGQSLLKQFAEDDFLTDVRRVLGDGFSRGDVGLETTARKLARSGRSLQRELNARGSSYRDELDRLRRDLALELLPLFSCARDLNTASVFGTEFVLSRISALDGQNTPGILELQTVLTYRPCRLG